MKKLIFLLILTLCLPACGRKDVSNSNYHYNLAQYDSYKLDDSLYTGTRLLAFPSDIESPLDGPYYKKELANLNYNKEVRFKGLHFRLPERAGLISSADSYFIDFPQTEEYGIKIEFLSLSTFENIDVAGSLEEIGSDLIEANNITNIKSKPVLNKLQRCPSLYFISQAEGIRTTHLLVETQSDIVYFKIYEDPKRSNASDSIMADMLATMYLVGDDPREVKKDFTDYKDELNIYATYPINLGDISLQIPENLEIHQQTSGRMVFLNLINNNITQEIIISQTPKDGTKTITDAFNENSGAYTSVAEIIGKDLVKSETINGYPYLRSKARLYTYTYTLEGDKITIDTGDSYLTLVITGPLANRNATNIMTTSIINSIK